MVEFKTKYDKDIIKKACFISIKVIIIPLILVSIGFLGLGIYNFVRGNIIVGLIWTIFCIGFIPVTYFITYLNQITKYNNLYLQENKEDLYLVDTYIFNEKDIIISTDFGDKNISSIKSNYDYFIKVVETKNDFIFYQNKNSICVIPKTSLTQGTIESFETLLSKNYQTEFKKRCR